MTETKKTLAERWTFDPDAGRYTFNTAHGDEHYQQLVGQLAARVTRHSGDAQFFDWPSCETIRMPGQQALDWMRGRAVLPPYERPKLTPTHCPCGAPYPKTGACWACGATP